ncbi:amidohydrolase family protein, partial [Acinetobacter baumannii]
LMPGLIDAHWHVVYAAIPLSTLLNDDMADVHLVAGKEAGATLTRGFTSDRDVGGPAFGLKQAIDRGVVDGLRHGSSPPYDVPRKAKLRSLQG